ncbi:hypothetical protein OG373_22875 [Streptomyces avidinii]|uniref:hypothetical protein n=1 Tax=Streptomyces avidinii TaxID=1895 RepID=UPI003869B512|nr:hypothetical protein OG373_22875 [Streptomyces avidinii]
MSDARRDRRPAVRTPARRAESGYGLRIADAVAPDRGVMDRLIGKTVRAEPGRYAGPPGVARVTGG